MPHTDMIAGLSSLRDWWRAMGVENSGATLALLERELRAQRVATRSGPAAQKASDGSVQVMPPKRGFVGTPEERAVRKGMETARNTAKSCASLPELAKAIEAFEHSPLKALATKTVTYEGVVGAPILVLGEGPDADEDKAGRPFVGPAGQLLDKMLAAISLSRETNCLISNVNYWRPPRNRNPYEEELAVVRPFVERMIVLSAPKLIIITGGVAAQSLLKTTTGITRMRGKEQTLNLETGETLPVIPVFHPAYLLRQPASKSSAWRDLLAIEVWLKNKGVEV